LRAGVTEDGARSGTARDPGPAPGRQMRQPRHDSSPHAVRRGL